MDLLSGRAGKPIMKNIMPADPGDGPNPQEDGHVSAQDGAGSWKQVAQTRNSLLFHKLNANGIGSFVAHFHFEAYLIVFFNWIDQAIDVNEYAFLGFHVFDETITL